MLKKPALSSLSDRRAPGLWLVGAALLMTVACDSGTESGPADPRPAEGPATQSPSAGPSPPASPTAEAATPSTEAATPSPPASSPADDGRIEIPLDGELGDEEASLARNFYFIFDGSGSMGKPPGKECRGDQQFPNKLAGAQWAVAEFLSKVPEDINLGLYLFDAEGSREVVPLGLDNRTDFLAAVNGVQQSGGTPLAQSILFGVKQLSAQYKKQLGYGEYRLVVVTDGLAKNIPRAAEIATSHGFPIYAIGLCIGEKHSLRTHAVSYRAADSFADLARGLEETLAELPSFDATTFDASAIQ